MLPLLEPQDALPAENVVNDLHIQPSFGTKFTPEYIKSLPRPSVNEAKIDEIVGSDARHKRRSVINLHREVWNSYLSPTVEALRGEMIRAFLRILSLKVQVITARLAFLTTPEFTWFQRWPSGSVALWSLLLFVAFVIAAASCVSVFKLVSNQDSLSTSPLTCAVMATISAAFVLAVKSGFTVCQTPQSKNRARLWMAILSAVLGAIYFALLSFYTGGLGANLLPIDRVGDPTATLGLPWLSPYLQLAGLLLDTSASISTTLFAELFVERHGTPDREKNPLKSFRARQYNAAIRALNSERTVISICRGCRLGLKSERKYFVAQAVFSFERKSRQARRQEDGIRRQRDDELAGRRPTRIRFLQRFLSI